MDEIDVSYLNSPVIEMIVSLRFEPIKLCPEALVGAYWNSVREQFPNVRAVPPIPPMEFNDGFWLPQRMRLELSQAPEFRLQMISADDAWVNQVQFDRWVLNWRKREAEYPRYSTVRDRASSLWRNWQAFLVDAGAGSIAATHWEVTYLNLVTPTDATGGIQGIGRLFPQILADTSLLSRRNEFAGLQARLAWNLGEGRGNVFVELLPHRDKKGNGYLLNLTARGELDDTMEVSDGWDFGHDEIIPLFESILSEEAKAVWGRE